jgi:hypothetical protein
LATERKQQEKTPGSSHFGNSEITWLEKDQREQLGEVVYPSETLRRRFWRQQPKVVTNVTSAALETCAVSDLQDLVAMPIFFYLKV